MGKFLWEQGADGKNLMGMGTILFTVSLSNPWLNSKYSQIHKMLCFQTKQFCSVNCVERRTGWRNKQTTNDLRLSMLDVTDVTALQHEVKRH